MNKRLAFGLICLVAVTFLAPTLVLCQDAEADKNVVIDVDIPPQVDEEIASHHVGGVTDDNAAEREEGTMAKERKMIDGEKFAFQAEVNQLMGIIVNSLYSNKEIFLREVISNASDALDKIRFQSLTDKAVLGDTPDLEIRIDFDKDAGTLTIRDTGIGMTKADLINALGNIAKSGTKEFVQQMADGADMSLIGQFGVGFYSVFLVADLVTVHTKNNDDKQYIWESTSESTYTIAEDEGEPLGRGTKIVLHMKEDASEYLAQHRLEELVTKYSEFINFPIYLNVQTSVEKEVPLEEGDDGYDDDEDEEEIDEEDDSEDDDEEDDTPKTKTITETVWEYKQVNKMQPIWLRRAKEVEKEDYDEFYKAISKDYSGPETYIHFNAEGDVEFKSILFIPSVAPHSLFDNYGGSMHNVKLYVRRVFITDDFSDLLPRYLNFVKGVVDSDDLPINVSREMLQESKTIKVIRRKLVRKAIEMIQVLAKNEQRALEEQREEEEEDEHEEDVAEEEPEDDVEDEEEQDDEDEDETDHIAKYANFYKNFGTNLKLGIIEDSANRARLTKLLRYYTSKSGDRQISLEEYVNNMPEHQEFIYYIAGVSKEAVEESPFLEALRKRDFDVIFMVDPIDEYTVQHLQDFDGKKLANVAKEGLKFGDETEDDKAKEKYFEEKYEPVMTFLKGELGEHIEKVAISHRVTDTPCVLVTSQYGWTANMERIMKAQALATEGTRGMQVAAKKVMEVNIAHPVIKELNKRVQDDPEAQDAKDVARLLYDTALLSSGFELDHQKDFAGRIHRMLSMSLQLDPNAPVEEDEYVPPPPEPEEDEIEEEEEEEEDEANEEDAQHDEL